MKKFYGVVTPLSTPMCADENVDYDSLESLCHFLIEKGINGLYPNGTTGEVIYLTADERKKILEHVVKAAAGRAVVFSMVGGDDRAGAARRKGGRGRHRCRHAVLPQAQRRPAFRAL